MTADAYQPELGQMIFGQPSQQFDGGNLLDAIINRLERELERVLWNRLQKEVPSPFSNTAATFEAPGIAIHAYSWDEEAEQPWNLKCGEVEVSWYKHAWRGVSINRQLTADEMAAFLDEALARIRACDTGDGYVDHPVGVTFIYDGTEYPDERGREMQEYFANLLPQDTSGVDF